MITIPQQKQLLNTKDSQQQSQSLYQRTPVRVRKDSFSDFNNVYIKLNDFIQAINQKINGRIQLVQQVYLDDYKKQVTIMSQELKKIRAVMDQQIIKQKSNQRLFYLQQQRDFFRAQVLKLNGDVQKSIEQNNKLKLLIQEKSQQLQNYKKITYTLETKIFKLKNQSIEAQRLKDLQIKEMNNANNGFSLKKKQSQSQLPTTDRYIKQDYIKTKPNFHKTTTRMKPSYSMKTYTKLNMFSQQVSQRQQTIDNCINQIKKQIYYRNLNLNQSNKIQFDQSTKVPFIKFTKTDKRQLIFKLISNPKILQDFYDFLFDKRNNNNQKFDKTVNVNAGVNTNVKPQRLTKLNDPKFNTKTLFNIKAQFNKKIYDLKMNN